MSCCMQSANKRNTNTSQSQYNLDTIMTHRHKYKYDTNTTQTQDTTPEHNTNPCQHTCVVERGILEPQNGTVVHIYQFVRSYVRLSLVRIRLVCDIHLRTRVATEKSAEIA